MIAAHKNVRILLSLLKQNNIRHFVLSPGSRNMSVVKSLEDDPFFTCYSVVDERSAAYFAIGLSLEVRRPVGICCTSAQATRNYLPGLTEAFYRKAPILAITADYDPNFTDQMNMQALRQMSIPSDCAMVSVDLPVVKDANDGHLVTRRVNEALDALTRKGGGPAHVNLRINHHWEVGDDTLETARRITRWRPQDPDWPVIGDRRVLVVVGQHHPFSEPEARALDTFAARFNAAVYVNHISNCHGSRTVHGNLRLASGGFGDLLPDLVITIGGHLGDYPIDGAIRNGGIEHWRVLDDGNFGDTYNTLTNLFECSETHFFTRMAEMAAGKASGEYHARWVAEAGSMRLPGQLPLSHALVARGLSPLIPPGSNLHLGILSSLRFWEFFALDPAIRCYANVAAFGIDGVLSTFVGQSVASDALNFLIIGDLSFFYDMNAIGIRHLRNNIRIVLVNNRGGGEFRQKTNAADVFGESANRHIAAGGHFGESAEGWVRNNAFSYRSVRREEELEESLRLLVQPSDRPVLVEVFTSMTDDAEALQSIVDFNDRPPQSQKIANAIKAHIPSDIKKGLKKMFGR